MVATPLALSATAAHAAPTTIDGQPSVEVDALDRDILDVSANGRYALVTEWGLGNPDARLSVFTGQKVPVPAFASHAHLTDDGSSMVFWTFNSYVPSDTNGLFDIYRYNFDTTAYQLIQLTNAPANWSFQLEDISGDGRYLGLIGSNAVIADSGAFIFDTATNTWYQPDKKLPDFANGPQRQSSTIRLSADGRYAAWVTYPLAGGRSEVWVYDRVLNTAVDATKRTDGAIVNDGSSTDPEISSDGRHIVFRSDGSHLVAGVNTTGSRVYARHLDTSTTVLVTAAETQDVTYLGPSIGGAGEEVMVLEKVPSMYGGGPMDVEQPVIYNLAGTTRIVPTDPVGSALPNGRSIQALMVPNGSAGLFTTNADNFTTVTPTSPPGNAAYRVFRTPMNPVLPARLLDTRSTGRTDDGQFEAGGVRTSGSTLQLQVAGRASIPLTAKAVVLNITAVGPAASGWITAFPCDVSQPVASSLNMFTGRTGANLAITKLSADGKICLFASQDTHLLVDVLSYMPAGAEIEPVVPQRMLDTRPTGSTIDHVAEQGGAVAAGGTLTLHLAGRGDVPAGAKAVVLNITAVAEQGDGYLKAYPCDAPVPNASVANYQSLVPKASETIVSLSASGDVCIFSSRQTHLLADAVGYFSSSSTYLALTPARLLETRPGGGSNVTVDHLFEGGGPRAAGSTLALTVSGRGGVPAGQHTVVLDVAAVGSPGSGFLAVFPCGQVRPSVSSVNLLPGNTVNNHVVVATGTAGAVCVYTSAATNILIDVEGVLP